MKFAAIASFALLTAASVTAQASPPTEQWEVIILTPSTAGDSTGTATAGATQAGSAYLATDSRKFESAMIWQGTAASGVSLDPTSGTGDSRIFATTGTQHGGYAQFPAGSLVAALWSGSPLTFQNLNPPTATTSQILAISSGNVQGGVAQFISGEAYHATVWFGTAESAVDLHPIHAAGIADSVVFAVSATQQGGHIAYDDKTKSSSAEIPSGVRAALWSGSPESYVDLHPAGTDHSTIRAIAGNTQAGSVGIRSASRGFSKLFRGAQSQAAIWFGTAESYVNLHPGGTDIVNSELTGTDGIRQVGTIVITIPLDPTAFKKIDETYESHAALWSGTPESVVDLHSYLPPDYGQSDASGISTENGVTTVIGTAFNETLGRNDAVIWRQGTPFTTIPTSEPVTTKILKKARNRTRFAVTNPGTTTATYRLSRQLGINATGRPNRPPQTPVNSPLIFEYLIDGKDITNAIENQRALVTIAPGQEIIVQVNVSTRRPLAFKRTINVRLTATNVLDPADTATIRTVVNAQLPLR